jgi:hypothetical protein
MATLMAKLDALDRDVQRKRKAVAAAHAAEDEERAAVAYASARRNTLHAMLTDFPARAEGIQRTCNRALMRAEEAELFAGMAADKAESAELGALLALHDALQGAAKELQRERGILAEATMGRTSDVAEAARLSRTLSIVSRGPGAMEGALKGARAETAAAMADGKREVAVASEAAQAAEVACASSRAAVEELRAKLGTGRLGLGIDPSLREGIGAWLRAHVRDWQGLGSRGARQPQVQLDAVIGAAAAPPSAAEWAQSALESFRRGKAAATAAAPPLPARGGESGTLPPRPAGPGVAKASGPLAALRGRLGLRGGAGGGARREGRAGSGRSSSAPSPPLRAPSSSPGSGIGGFFGGYEEEGEGPPLARGGGSRVAASSAESARVDTPHGTVSRTTADLIAMALNGSISEAVLSPPPREEGAETGHVWRRSVSFAEEEGDVDMGLTPPSSPLQAGGEGEGGSPAVTASPPEHTTPRHSQSSRAPAEGRERVRARAAASPAPAPARAPVVSKRALAFGAPPPTLARSDSPLGRDKRLSPAAARAVDRLSRPVSRSRGAEDGEEDGLAVRYGHFASGGGLRDSVARTNPRVGKDRPPGPTTRQEMTVKAAKARPSVRQRSAGVFAELYAPALPELLATASRGLLLDSKARAAVEGSPPPFVFGPRRTVSFTGVDEAAAVQPLMEEAIVDALAQAFAAAVQAAQVRVSFRTP